MSPRRRRRSRSRRGWLRVAVLGGVVALLVAIAGWVFRTAPPLLPVDAEIAIGRDAHAQMRQAVPELSDRLIVDYVRVLGRALAASAPGPRYPYSFHVADHRDLNAFALPGGPVWVHRGALAAAGREDQIAAILAHEIVHVAQRHAARQLTKGVVANGFLGLLGAMLGNDASARTARAGAGVLATGLFLQFSRNDELEADRIAVVLLSRAGWDPGALAEFMEVVRREQRRRPASVEVFFSTHPTTDGRIDALRETVRSLARGQRATGQFPAVQRRLAQLSAVREPSR
jgi:predicted Zn-dependent protease